MREIDGFQIQTVADDPALVDRIQGLIDDVWPKFVTQSTSPKTHTLPFSWFGIYDHWPHLQFALIDPVNGAMVAACNALTLAWEGSADELPDTGWNWAMHQARQDLAAGRTPTMGCGLSVTVDPARRGQRRPAHGRRLDQRRGAGRRHDDRGAAQHALRGLRDPRRPRLLVTGGDAPGNHREGQPRRLEMGTDHARADALQPARPAAARPAAVRALPSGRVRGRSSARSGSGSAAGGAAPRLRRAAPLLGSSA